MAQKLPPLMRLPQVALILFQEPEGFSFPLKEMDAPERIGPLSPRKNRMDQSETLSDSWGSLLA